MTSEELHREQLEEMRNDMLQEQQLRSDYEIALDFVIDKHDLHSVINAIKQATDELEFYGWPTNKLNLIKELL